MPLWRKNYKLLLYHTDVSRHLLSSLRINYKHVEISQKYYLKLYLVRSIKTTILVRCLSRNLIGWIRFSWRQLFDPVGVQK